MPEFVTVCQVGDIPDGEGRAFEFEDQMVAVFNRSGEYYAIDDMCPHMGASLASGFFDAADCTVTCPWHAWRFDTTDGTWCDNRRLKIDTYEVQVSGDEIQIAPVENSEPDATDAKTDQPPVDPSLIHPAEDQDEES